MDAMLTEAEAAERLNISTRTLADARRAGEGPRWYDLGTAGRALVRYRAEDLDAWLAERAK